MAEPLDQIQETARDRESSGDRDASFPEVHMTDGREERGINVMPRPSMLL